MILSISGASGTGKTTIISSLASTLDNFRRLRSVTTRPPRQDDIPGEVDAISEREFAHLLDTGELAWSVKIFGHHYGSLMFDLANATRDKSSVLLCDVAWEALPEIRKMLGNSIGSPPNFFSVYLAAPAIETIMQRLRIRGMKDEEIELRLRGHADQERQQLTSGQYDLIINSNLTTERICALLKALS